MAPAARETQPSPGPNVKPNGLDLQRVGWRVVRMGFCRETFQFWRMTLGRGGRRRERRSVEVQPVGRMLAPGCAGPVIHPCGVRAGVAGRVLDGLQWDAHVQQRGDEGVAQAVGVHAINLVLTFADQPGGLGKVTEQSVDGLPVERNSRRRVAGLQSPTVLAAEDRAL